LTHARLTCEAPGATVLERIIPDGCEDEGDEEDKNKVGASKREKIMETRKSEPIKKPNGDLHWHNWMVDGTQIYQVG